MKRLFWISSKKNMIRQSPVTDYSPKKISPEIAETAYVDPQGVVLGYALIDEYVYVAPFASVRGDEGAPIFIGAKSNIQDGVIIHGMKNRDRGKVVETNSVEAFGEYYSVYIGSQVSLAHQSHVHGPVKIGNNTFIGMKAFILQSTIGSDVVVEPGASCINVDIPQGRYVPAGSVVTSQEEADDLPLVDSSYAFHRINHEIVQVNVELAKGYNSL
jgi:carbonic anhydrase